MDRARNGVKMRKVGFTVLGNAKFGMRTLPSKKLGVFWGVSFAENWVYIIHDGKRWLAVDVVLPSSVYGVL